MANIVFINILSKMTMATGHLMGALAQQGHKTHTINFKRQEPRTLKQDPAYDPGQYPLRSYGIAD